MIRRGRVDVVVIGDEEVAREIEDGGDVRSVAIDPSSEMVMERIEIHDPTVIVVATDTDGARSASETFDGYRPVVGLRNGRSAVSASVDHMNDADRSVEDVIVLADGMRVGPA